MSSAPPGTIELQRNDRTEIRIYSHSTLFYWWPVWLCALVFALLTWVEGHRMAILPDIREVHVEPDANEPLAKGQERTITMKTTATSSKSLIAAANQSKAAGGPQSGLFRPFISERSWMGSIFVVLLLVVVFITNVPLRGLWSVISIVSVILLVLILALLDILDELLSQLGNLHIYINMAGYLTIGLVLFVMWALVVRIFDRQVYMIFTPGQMRICTEIGGGETTYDTIGMVIQKKRDDLFRHWVLGLGSGDLVVRTSGAQAHEFTMENVLFVGTKLAQVQEMQRDRPMVQG